MDVLRVLICDDVADTRDLFAEMIELSGHAVEIAVDGRSALQRILDGGLDAAVIDIGLPDMSGYAVARAIRGHTSKPRIRLIAITGYATAADQATATFAGFDEWFAKPVKMDVLLAALRRPG
jgi:CheY-like chemotaxis protein